MSSDSLRLQSLGRWLYRRYVDEVEEHNSAGAIKRAEALFFIRYGCGRTSMPYQWDAFERDLFRLASSEVAKARDAHLSVLGF